MRTPTGGGLTVLMVVANDPLIPTIELGDTPTTQMDQL
jgi:hypothetical protein